MFETMDQETKERLWCYGACQDLETMGIIEGDNRVTSLGVSEFDQLVASGFKASDESILQFAQLEAEEDSDIMALYGLLLFYRDHKDKLDAFVAEHEEDE